MTPRITGIFNILATPFKPDQTLDLVSLRQLVEFQIARGVSGLTILGVMGEVAKLSLAERECVQKTVIETVRGRVPVIVGVSHDEIDSAVKLACSAAAAGADGVMLAPPPMPNDDDTIIALYARIAEAVNCAIVVQDFPPVNGVTMSAAMLARLAESIPTARYLKLEDPPLMEKIAAVRAMTDRFEIFGGLGGMFLLEELRAGATGTMTGFAFSEILVAVYEAYQMGEYERACRIFDHYLPLIRFENQPVINLTIRKLLLHLRGAIAHPTLRVPFAPVSATTHSEIAWILARVGITDATAHVTFTG